MAKLAVYVERYTIAQSEELEALLRYKLAAERRGHELHYLFRSELLKIPRFDALFIRALTDPLNASYVASRLAELHGIPVIDDAQSIRVCCDKVNMYSRLIRAGVAIPATQFLKREDITATTAERLFADLGKQLILKAPNSSFSSHVEKVETPDEFVQVGKRFLSRADRVVVQKFVRSDFDWRVGVLAGKPLYACRYLIPDKTFKIQAVVDGHMRYAKVEGVHVKEAPPEVIELACAAANAVGQGLYGVDLKALENGETVVIEVNDNPTINAGEEDQHAPDIYDRIVVHLLEGPSHTENVS